MPPKNGPVKLPILRAIPQSRFPVGSSSFGVKSAIKVIPNENIEPTNVPVKKNATATAICECSTKLAMPKITAPPNEPIIKTLRRPTLSPIAPSGTCVKIPPNVKTDKIIGIGAFK